jgi:hypothetical protein
LVVFKPSASAPSGLGPGPGLGAYAPPRPAPSMMQMDAIVHSPEHRAPACMVPAAAGWV